MCTSGAHLFGRRNLYLMHITLRTDRNYGELWEAGFCRPVEYEVYDESASSHAFTVVWST